MIEFNDEVEDVLTRYSGVVIARKEYCYEPIVDYLVQPRKLTEQFQPMEPTWFPETRLRVTKKGG